MSTVKIFQTCSSATCEQIPKNRLQYLDIYTMEVNFYSMYDGATICLINI